MKKLFRINFFGQTTEGTVRKNNEDNFYPNTALKTPAVRNLGLVADGMGGHNCGEVASEIAALQIPYQYKAYKKCGLPKAEIAPDMPYEVSCLKRAVQKANDIIYDEARKDRDKIGMGTTATSLLLLNSTMWFAHVGDSQAYIIRKNIGKNGAYYRQLTEDHSLMMEYFKNGWITEADFENFPQKNIITRALGVKERVEVDLGRVEVSNNDRFMLTSDGLFKSLTKEQVFGIIDGNRDDAKACGEIINEALSSEKGSPDNITVVIGTVLPA